MSKKALVGFILLSIILFAAFPAAAGEANVTVDTLSNKLINTLVEKGVLIKDEAQEAVGQLKVGAGFAGGGANPHAINQTFENIFQHSDFR